MDLTKEILYNKFGQNLLDEKVLINDFESLSIDEKRQLLTDIAFLIIQSKPIYSDIENSMVNASLKATYTPCVILKRDGIKLNSLERLINLPEDEQLKTFRLFIYLFKISYQRRFEQEKGNPEKWWYWDLSNQDNISKINDLL